MLKYMICFCFLAVHCRVDAQCPKTVVINYTKIWNDLDQKTLDGAKVRCGQKYPQSPCLTKFIKKDVNAYNAICGKRR